MKNLLQICAAMVALVGFADESFQVVSNTTGVTYRIQREMSASSVLTPADRVLQNRGGVALIYEAHESSSYTGFGVATNKCRGVWNGTSTVGITITDIKVSDNNVVLTAEERFLVCKGLTIREMPYHYDHSGQTRNFNCIFYPEMSVAVEQECEPPAPWTTHGAYAPYCRSAMTNRLESISAYSGVTRKVMGYYDADGDGYATVSRCVRVQDPNGDYLNESLSGEYYAVNDVLIVKYTIPRASYINYVYGTEDSQNHYWLAIKAFYRLTFTTTDLEPWWRMPEYQ